jgi:hypothetical protein
LLIGGAGVWGIVIPPNVRRAILVSLGSSRAAVKGARPVAPIEPL